MTSNKTRAERIEELLREAQDILADYCPGFEVIQNSIEMTLAMPPDPPRGDGWEALRELRDWIADEANGRGFTVDTVFNRIDRLLAAAPKEPEPEPAESPVPAINMSGSGELSFDWWCGERNLTVFGENVTFLASHNAEPHEMIDGKVADLDHLRELQKWVADGGVVPQRGPQLDESPAEPAQDDEAAIGAWLQRIGGVSADCHRMPAHIDEGVYGAMQSGYAIMCRLAREKADLRAKLAAASKITAMDTPEKVHTIKFSFSDMDNLLQILSEYSDYSRGRSIYPNFHTIEATYKHFCEEFTKYLYNVTSQRSLSQPIAATEPEPLRVAHNYRPFSKRPRRNSPPENETYDQAKQEPKMEVAEARIKELEEQLKRIQSIVNPKGKES